MMSGLETVVLIQRQKDDLEVADLKIVRSSLGVSIIVRIRNEYIAETALVEQFGDKVRMLKMDLPGRKKRGKLHRRLLGI